VKNFNIYKIYTTVFLELTGNPEKSGKFQRDLAHAKPTIYHTSTHIDFKRTGTM